MAFNKFNEEVGLLQRGAIVGFNWDKGFMLVQLANNSAITGDKPLPKHVPLPHSMFYNNGMFIGAHPSVGTPVVIGQGTGGQYYFVSFLAENVNFVPSIDDDQILLQANDNTKITLSQTNDIVIGNDDNFIHLDTDSKLITSYFSTNNQFTQGTRLVVGPVTRDLRPNVNFSQSVKLTSDVYNDRLFAVGMDPTFTTNSLISGSEKNPSFVEHREIVYEFAHDTLIKDDYTESLLYSNAQPPTNIFSAPNRRKSRTDTLSLTLASPNFLIETVKGTIVDIFGNILDINRVPIPIGIGIATLRDDGKTTDKHQAFLQIKELERKSIAFHFELNARKDLTSNSGQISLPDINSNADYSRNRSRFFFDIDKEGQFKFNVPASSEKGNVALLTRYENYSTFGDDDNGNPDKLIFRDDNLDISQDSFAAPRASFNNDGVSFADARGSINIMNDTSIGTPIDRITGSHIKHGMAYHDVLNTCFSHQSNDYLSYPDEWSLSNFPISSNLPVITIASPSIVTNGPNANAGGRSGTISMDGSLEWNIGANTIDRQSLWVDMAGGMVWNVGRDLRGNSAIMAMDGNVYMQIGGFGVATDSRFASQPNGYLGAVLDIRVLNSGGRATLIRIDNNGISIMSPGNIAIHAGQDLKISADADISIEAETVSIQGRGVLKEFGGSI